MVSSNEVPAAHLELDEHQMSSLRVRNAMFADTLLSLALQSVTKTPKEQALTHPKVFISDESPDHQTNNSLRLLRILVQHPTLSDQPGSIDISMWFTNFQMGDFSTQEILDCSAQRLVFDPTDGDILTTTSVEWDHLISPLGLALTAMGAVISMPEDNLPAGVRYPITAIPR